MDSKKQIKMETKEILIDDFVKSYKLPPNFVVDKNSIFDCGKIRLMPELIIRFGKKRDDKPTKFNLTKEEYVSILNQIQ